MESAEIQRYQEMLLDLRPRLNDEIQRSIDAVAEEVQPPGEDTKEPTEGLEKELAVEKSQEEILNAVNEALDRIKQGVFGQCVECAANISTERLDAIPYTAYCIACEEIAERG